MTDCCEIYGVPFTAWEIRLYLDTHPDDRAALEAFAKLYDRCGGDAPAFRGISRSDLENGHFGYCTGPWPWEPDANCRIGSGARGPLCERGGM